MALASFIDCRLNELNWTNCDTVTDFLTVNKLISDYSEVHSKKWGITMDVLLKLEITLKFTIVLPFLIYSTAVFITVLSCYEIQCNNLMDWMASCERIPSLFHSLKSQLINRYDVCIHWQVYLRPLWRNSGFEEVFHDYFQEFEEIFVPFFIPKFKFVKHTRIYTETFRSIEWPLNLHEIIRKIQWHLFSDWLKDYDN